MNQLLEKKYLKLQNGSDVRGVALENPDGEQVNLTPEIVTYIAAAFAEYLAEKVGKDMSELTISVGHDSRLSADALKAGVLAGIQKQGCQAVDCSLASTPSMFMSTVLPQLSYDGAIMIQHTKAKLWIEAGLIDTVCPPECVIAAFNVAVSPDKTLYTFPYRPHSDSKIDARVRENWLGMIDRPRSNEVMEWLK